MRRILSEAGFLGIAMEPCPLCSTPRWAVASRRGQGAFEIGPVSRALEGQPDELRAAAANSIRETLAPFAKGNTVLLPASIWIVTAKAS